MFKFLQKHSAYQWLTRCGLLTLFGFKDFGHHWFRKWHFAYSASCDYLKFTSRIAFHWKEFENFLFLSLCFQSNIFVKKIYLKLLSAKCWSIWQMTTCWYHRYAICRCRWVSVFRGRRSLHAGYWILITWYCQWYRPQCLPCICALQWRHNEHNGVSNHQPQDCLLDCLFKAKINEISKLRVTGLCAGNSPVTGEFPAQRASNAENVSIWWYHCHLSKKWNTWYPQFTGEGGISL